MIVVIGTYATEKTLSKTISLYLLIEEKKIQDYIIFE